MFQYLRLPKGYRTESELWIRGVFDDNRGIIFLISLETTCSDPSSEPSQRDSLGERSQHMFYCRIKNYP